MKFSIKFAALFTVVFLLAVAGIFMAFSKNSVAKFSRPQFSIHEEVNKADVALGKRIQRKSRPSGFFSLACRDDSYLSSATIFSAILLN